MGCRVAEFGVGGVEKKKKTLILRVGILKVVAGVRVEKKRNGKFPVGGWGVGTKWCPAGHGIFERSECEARNEPKLRMVGRLPGSGNLWSSFSISAQAGCDRDGAGDKG